MSNFIYPAILTLDQESEGFIVTFVDLPEAITQGDTLTDALSQAVDCLEEAIVGRIRRNDAVPEPSPLQEGNYPIRLPTQTTLKTALYLALQANKMSKSEFAERLHCDEKTVRRLLDPRRPSKLARMEAALVVLGQQLVISIDKAFSY